MGLEGYGLRLPSVAMSSFSAGERHGALPALLQNRAEETLKGGQDTVKGAKSLVRVMQSLEPGPCALDEASRQQASDRRVQH